MNDPKSYEKQPGETDLQWRGFVTYRDAEDRRYSVIAPLVGTTKGLISKWASKFKWRDRVADWDNAIDARKRRGTLRAVEEMQERHTLLALQMQSIAVTELAKLARKAKEDSEDLVIDPDLVLKLTKEGTSLERVTKGEPTSINKEKGELKIVWEEQHADSADKE